MSDLQNLGPVGTWQIKNFPDELRRAIVDRAMVERATVGELLTRVIVAVMAADWQVGQAVNPSDTPSTVVDLDRVTRAISASALLAASDLIPPAFRRRANRLLRDSLPAPAPQALGAGLRKRLGPPDPQVELVALLAAPDPQLADEAAAVE